MTIIDYSEKYDLILSAFTYDGIEAELAEGVNIIAVIKEYAKVGSCYIGIENLHMVGAGGIAPVWDGVGFAWLFMNKNADIKHTLKICKKVLAESKYRRIHTHCLDNPKTARFLEHLGFEYEGRMKKFYKTSDALMYSIVKGG